MTGISKLFEPSAKKCNDIVRRATTFKQGKHSAHFNIDSTLHDDSTSDFNHLFYCVKLKEYYVMKLIRSFH